MRKGTIKERAEATIKDLKEENQKKRTPAEKKRRAAQLLWAFTKGFVPFFIIFLCLGWADGRVKTCTISLETTTGQIDIRDLSVKETAEWVKTNEAQLQFSREYLYAGQYVKSRNLTCVYDWNRRHCVIPWNKC